MSDINYFSITDGGYTIDAGSPNSYSIDALPVDGNFTPSNPGDYSDILKFSNKQNLTLTGIHVAQGKEDSVDINNHCSDIHLDGDFAVSGSGNQVFTIKGESKNITISGMIITPGAKCDVEIGNWSDQSYGLTSNVDVSSLRRKDGQPVRVRIGRATNVELGLNKEDKFGGLLIKAYWWIKWSARKILNIKVGEKGPSWL